MAEVRPGKNDPTTFDDVTVDSLNFRVEKGGKSVTLKPRDFDVLIYLIKNRGRVVEKQELFDQIWKDTFVSDNALTRVIKEIRHALGDTADHPKYIETVPRRGYRFIGSIREDVESVPPSATEESPQSAIVNVVAAVVDPVLDVVTTLVGWLRIRPEPAQTYPNQTPPEPREKNETYTNRH